MSRRRSFVPLIVFILVVAAITAAMLAFSLKRRPRVAMEAYVPQSALAFIEIDDLPGLVDNFTSTELWRKLAPALGLSNDLRYLGSAGRIASLGLAPTEAVLLSRAQYAIVVTGVEAVGEEIKPRIALIAETHSDSESVKQIADTKLPLLARRIFGEGVSSETSQYNGVMTRKLFLSGATGKQIIAATIGSILIVANHESSIEAAIDARLGRIASMALNPQLQKSRTEIGQKSQLFAFATSDGASKLFQLSLHVLAGGLVDAISEKIDIGEAFSSSISRSLGGLAYSASFENGIVVDRYLYLLEPQIASAIRNQVKVVADNPRALDLIPQSASSFRVIMINRPSQALDALLAAISSRVDFATSYLTRQAVIELGKQFGLRPEESIADALGDELAVVSFPQAEMAFLIEVKDQATIAPVVRRYLLRSGSAVKTEDYNGIDFFTSADNQKSAAFIGRFLVLASRNQMASFIDARVQKRSIGSQPGIQDIFKERPSDAMIISYKSDRSKSGELMLAIAKLLRASSGDPDILRDQPIQSALASLPPNLAFTRLNNDCIVTEERSAAGNFTILSMILGGE